MESAPGHVSYTLPQFFSSLGGFYLEAGARPMGRRFGLGVRYRDVLFSQKGIYLSGNPNGTNRYGLRSVQVSATARL